MESWRAADIKCPYYKNCDDNRRLIICEGIMERTTVSTKFRRRKDMANHIATNCEQIASPCAIRKLDDKKYENLG